MHKYIYIFIYMCTKVSARTQTSMAAMGSFILMGAWKRFDDWLPVMRKARSTLKTRRYTYVAIYIENLCKHMEDTLCVRQLQKLSQVTLAHAPNDSYWNFWLRIIFQYSPFDLASQSALCVLIIVIIMSRKFQKTPKSAYSIRHQCYMTDGQADKRTDRQTERQTVHNKA